MPFVERLTAWVAAVIKKVRVEKLKPGIFVHDFNCGWLHHPFLKNRIKLATETEIEKVVNYGIREVYIDTDQGLDVDGAPSQHDIDRTIDGELRALGSARHKGSDDVPLALKANNVKTLIAEAKLATQRLMDGVRLGKQIDMGQVETLIDRMTESVLDDGDALVSLLRIKSKDEYTYLHSLAVSALCISFAQSMNFDGAKIKGLGIGGLLHDIGKVKIPKGILNKPGPLTQGEFEIMKQHVHYGNEVLQQTTRLDECSICVTAHHHERLDGTGYPQGLRGDQISLFGQISAIVDIYDALTSERCYKAPMAPTAALRKVFEWSGAYLNRALVEKFVTHIGIYPVGSVVRLRSGAIGVVVRHGEKDLLHPVVRIVFDWRQQRAQEAPQVDLSQTVPGSDANEIVGCESSERLKIDPLQYLY